MAQSDDDKEFEINNLGGNCASCGIWVTDVVALCCDECWLPTCQSCGKVDEDDGLFLCGDCFLLTY